MNIIEGASIIGTAMAEGERNAHNAGHGNRWSKYETREQTARKAAQYTIGLAIAAFAFVIIFGLPKRALIFFGKRKTFIGKIFALVFCVIPAIVAWLGLMSIVAIFAYAVLSSIFEQKKPEEPLGVQAAKIQKCDYNPFEDPVVVREKIKKLEEYSQKLESEKALLSQQTYNREQVEKEIARIDFDLKKNQDAIKRLSGYPRRQSVGDVAEKNAGNEPDISSRTHQSEELKVQPRISQVQESQIPEASANFIVTKANTCSNQKMHALNELEKTLAYLQSEETRISQEIQTSHPAVRKTFIRRLQAIRSQITGLNQKYNQILRR